MTARGGYLIVIVIYFYSLALLAYMQAMLMNKIIMHILDCLTIYSQTTPLITGLELAIAYHNRCIQMGNYYWF